MALKMYYVVHSRGQSHVRSHTLKGALAQAKLRGYKKITKIKQFKSYSDENKLKWH